MDRQPKQLVSLLHPLASLAEWKEYRRTPVDMRDAQAVVLGDKVYLGGGDAPDSPSTDLLIYDFTEDSWDKLSTPTQWYSLAVYRSQLVLVGGLDPLHNTVTNKLWVLDNKHEWIDSTIPAMPTERFGASAMSVDKHLVVAGGNKGGSDGHLNVVEVYDGHEWRRIQSLPQSCSGMKSVVDEGFWYLAGGVGQGKKVFYASLDSLIALEGVWEILPEAPIERSTPVIFGMQLTTVGGFSKSAMHAYSHRTKTWIHVGDLPVAYSHVCSLVLPSQELLMVGRKAQAEITSHVFRAKIHVASFPDSKFTISALDRLEAVSGISVYKHLASKLPAMVSTFSTDTRDMYQEWISRVYPPTWQTLLGVLFGIDHPLAKAIEDFLKPKTQTASPQLFMWKRKEEEQQIKPEVNALQLERDRALEHNKLLKAENERLKLELARALHHSDDAPTDMETTVIGVVQKGREDPRYRAGFYYIGSKFTFWRVHFVAIKDLEAYKTAVTNYLKDAVIGAEIKLEFEKDSISLDIPCEGTEVNGWVIQVITPTVVTKQQVDEFQPGTLVPSCQLELYCNDEQQKRLCHRVALIGAKEPFNFLAIQSDIMPLSQQPQRTSSVKPILDEDHADLRSKYPNGLSDEPQLSDLIEQVAAKIPAKWRKVGIALNLNQSDLECLPVLDCHQCFVSIFTTWKKEETSPYTWLTVLDALKTKSVGENHLAQVITSKLLK